MSDGRYKDPDVLRELYWDEEMTLREVADELGVGHGTIRRWMEHHGIERRERLREENYENFPTGPDHGSWEGGRWVKSNGYVVVRKPDHFSTDEENDRIYEHRYVAERELGRELDSSEVVHHKNGDKTDNRWENLEVMDVGEHTKIHIDEILRKRGDA